MRELTSVMRVSSVTEPWATATLRESVSAFRSMEEQVVTLFILAQSQLLTAPLNTLAGIMKAELVEMMKEELVGIVKESVGTVLV